MMVEFLSEENINLHRDYVRNTKLKYSIIESSISKLKGAGVREVLSMKLSQRDKDDALRLLPEIAIHDIYFSSFDDRRFPHSALVAKHWGSESAFLNEVYRNCMAIKYGFVAIFRFRNIIAVKGFEDCLEIFKAGTPLLAVDVCEHVYFMDYGFDKERYLVNALSYLDITKLTADI